MDLFRWSILFNDGVSSSSPLNAKVLKIKYVAVATNIKKRIVHMTDSPLTCLRLFKIQCLHLHAVVVLYRQMAGEVHNDAK